MRKIIFTLLFLATQMWLSAQTTWNVDPAHSNIRFTVTHLVISEVEGSFRNFNGTITSEKPDFTDANIDFTVDVLSVYTDNDMRDKHLRTEEFFNTDKFPKMTFKSTSFKHLTGKKYELSGNLTIRDVTKPVKFDVTYNGTIKDMQGNQRAGFKAKTELNRFDYGLKWNSLTSAGDAVVGSDVAIALNLEFVKSKDK